jgi:Electron transfer DM13
MLKDVLSIMAAGVLGFGGYLTLIEPSQRSLSLNDPEPTGFDSSTIYQSKLFGQKEQISGTVRVMKDGDKTIVRLENFKRVPDLPACLDLRAQLNLDLEANNSLDLGPFRATSGNINFEIPSTEEYTMYNKFMLWCKTYRSNYAEADIIAPDKRPLFLK